MALTSQLVLSSHNIGTMKPSEGHARELIFKEEVFQIIGAAMEVYYKLGRGFGEPIYQEAFVRELTHRKIPNVPQCELFVYYKGKPLTTYYKPDVVCFGEVIIELKALDRLTSIEESQILNYMRVSQKRVGLLINFGSRGNLEWKRYAL